MKVSLSVQSYKGVDGSSLSPIRCLQIVKVYEMLESLGNKRVTYKDIQEEAQNKHLFGSTAADSAIRTFFPLLKKLGFVDYDGTFAANECFKELGVQFVLISRAISNLKPDTKNRFDVEEKLTRIKYNIQKEGLINMFNNPEYESHNIWIALKLFKRFRVINWNEFLYVLYSKEYGKTTEEAIDFLSQNKEKVEDYEFVNEKGNALPNTCYSYIRSLLIETGLITSLNSSISSVTDDADEFFNAINL